MRILQLCPRVPFPLHDGGAIAMADVALGLARVGHQVTVLAINTPKHHQADPKVMGPLVRLITGFVDTRVTPLGALRGLFDRQVPYNVARFVDEGFRRQLADLLQAETFDLIQLEGTFVAPYLPTIRQHSTAPVVLRAHNLECQIWERLARHERNPLKRWYRAHLAAGLRRFETRVAGEFDAIAAITELDRRQWAALAGPDVRTVSIAAGVDRTRLRPDPGVRPNPQAVGMIGSLNWQPNLEGVRWLLDHVWPQVRARLPHLELHIAGSHPPAWLLQLREPGVVVHGFVPSAAAFMQQQRLLLVPLLSGGGMRIKIIEAMSLGCPLLTTQIGGEGIDAEAGREWLVADDPAEWVRLIEACCTGALDPAAIGQAAGALAARAFDNVAVVRQFEALYAQLRAAPVPAPPARP